ncbi:UNVERIFIED_CONTAM: hypothetical protein FKN15_051382 [Acipenser sinensis]
MNHSGIFTPILQESQRDLYSSPAGITAGSLLQSCRNHSGIFTPVLYESQRDLYFSPAGITAGSLLQSCMNHSGIFTPVLQESQRDLYSSPAEVIAVMQELQLCPHANPAGIETVLQSTPIVYLYTILAHGSVLQYYICMWKESWHVNIAVALS